jgi:peroxiredoxin (alkyl hydroperoxide reductase subunit C)
MGEEMEVGCARPTGGPVGETVAEDIEKGTIPIKEAASMIQVEKKGRIS